MTALSIRPLSRNDIEGCLKVVASLPRFFGVEDNGPRGLAQAARDLTASGGGLIAAGPGGDVVGFVTWKKHTEQSAEITWMAVHASLRGHGVGSALLKRLERILNAQGYRRLSLLTSASSHTYEPTRQFWAARDFAPLLKLEELWDTDVVIVFTKELS